MKLTSATTTTTTSTTSSTTIKTDTTTSSITTSTKSTKAKNIAGIYYSNKSSDIFLIPTSFDKVSACVSVDNTLEVKSCSMEGGKLKMTIDKKKSASGVKAFNITADGKTQTISFRLLRQSDIDKILGVFKDNYIRYDSVTTNTTTKKITYQKNLTEVKKNLAGDINVLLYELSTDLSRREMSCDGKCKIEADGKVSTVDRFIVESGNGYLYLTIGENMTRPKTIKISSTNGGVVKFDNYKRNSYAKVPWNIFRGTITFQKEQVKDLNSGKYKEQYAVINTLPFNDYLA
ncbi:hypothetical protein KKH82_00500 [Patescibacteria group bacterium]|nr:hypothetical protein [Patescibacteria group bacterium]